MAERQHRRLDSIKRNVDRIKRALDHITANIDVLRSELDAQGRNVVEATLIKEEDNFSDGERTNRDNEVIGTEVIVNNETERIEKRVEYDDLANFILCFWNFF